jgi:hypothetical protein
MIEQAGNGVTYFLPAWPLFFSCRKIAQGTGQSAGKALQRHLFKASYPMLQKHKQKVSYGEIVCYP